MDPVAAYRQTLAARGPGPYVSVHRGLWGPAPENSLAAIHTAEPLGIVEIDVQLAADGVPTVFHDSDMGRMTAAQNLVRDLDHHTLAATRLRIGRGGAEQPQSQETIPTLADVINSAAPGSYYDFDVKHAAEVQPVAAFLAQLGGQRLGSIKVDTATRPDIDALLALQQRFGIMVMAKVVLPQAGLGHIGDLVQAGVGAAELWFDNLDQLRAACDCAGDRMTISTYTLDPVHCCGLSDSVATKDPAAVWGRLLDAGVGIIMTDRAPDLAAYLGQR